MRLPEVPQYIVLEPRGGLAIPLHLEAPACELDVQMEGERPGRSFVLMIGHPGGPFVQRVRLSGRAKIYFDPDAAGEYVLMLSNPMEEPVVVHLSARDIPRIAGKAARATRSARPSRKGRNPRRRAAQKQM